MWSKEPLIFSVQLLRNICFAV